MRNKLYKTIEVAGLIFIILAGILTACQPAASNPARVETATFIVGETESYKIRFFLKTGYGKCFVLEDKKGEPKFLQCN